MGHAMPGEHAEFKHRTLQWLIIGLWMAFCAVVLYLEWDEPENKRAPLGCALAFFTALSQGLWITIDLKIRNRPVRGWRFGALFLGPLVIWPYMILTYRMRALWMIPLSLVIYVFPGAAAAVAVAVLSQPS